MDKINKLLKELINVSLINEADIRALRRVVILSIFADSAIPLQLKKAFKDYSQSGVTPDVKKANTKFLEQITEDEATLINDENYIELKQDLQFIRLAKIINSKLKYLSAQNEIRFDNVVIGNKQTSKKYSYSTVLYIAIPNEVEQLSNYLSQKYGPKFVFSLLKTKEMGSSPETNNLNELDLPSMIASKTPVEDLDREIGTRLAKRYTYPSGYSEDFIEKTITDIKPQNPKFKDPTYQENLDDAYKYLVQVNRTTLGGIKADTPLKKWNLVYGVISHYNTNDMKFFVETWPGGEDPEGKSYFDTITALEQKFDVPINWIPSPNSLYIITQAIDKKFNK